MIQRLYILFFEDRVTRIKMYCAFCATLMFIAVVFRISGMSALEAIKPAAVSAGVVLAIWTIIYCLQIRPVQVFAPYSPARRTFVLAGGLIAFSIAVTTSETRLEAALINRRLRKLLPKSKFTESDFKEIAITLKQVRTSPLSVSARVDPSIIAELGKKLFTPDGSENLTGSAQNAAELAASVRSGLTQGSHLPSLSLGIGTGLYNTYTECLLREEQLKLDTNAYIRSYVVDCAVAYEGGPVYLKDTVFIRCTFKFSTSPEARALLLLLTQRSDPHFSYKAEEIRKDLPQ